uniref:RNA polymerase sigma factor n=1 Tax=Gemmiger formicilis TaxID=745368 RepID=UPI003FEFFB6C
MPLPELPELEELYRLYRTDLYRYLCHLTHDPAEAEDLLSETFLRALKRLQTYRGGCAVKTWLFGIARNIWLESLRKRRPTVSADDLLETYLTDDTLPDHTDTRLQWQRVQALLQQKDDRARRVVQLRAMGYSYNEIAAELHISESSARVIEHRTRTWLKQMLAKEGYDL